MEHFWVIRGYQRSGPYTEAEILRAYQSGELKPVDCLWAEGVPVPVPVEDAFRHMLGQEPTGEIDLTLVDVDEPPAHESPYRPPLAAVEDRSEGEVRYAGFWVRYAASLLDAIILGSLGALVGFVLGMALEPLGAGPGRAVWITMAAGFIVGWLYVVLGESGPASATWGKRAFHLQVLGAERLDRISFARATGRLLARYLSMLLVMIGYLMQPFNARKRALHDFLCNTVVVVERQYSRLLVAVLTALGVVLPVVIGAAVVVPAYQHYVVLGRVSAALRQVTPATVAIQGFLAAHGHAPVSLAEVGFDTRRALDGVRRLDYDPASGVIDVMLDVEPVRGNTVLIVPNQIQNDAITWSCQAGTLPARWVPRQCPPGG